jgi:hypothetical protein
MPDFYDFIIARFKKNFHIFGWLRAKILKVVIIRKNIFQLLFYRNMIKYSSACYVGGGVLKDFLELRKRKNNPKPL